jgi:tRNA(Ile)-lysidine synthase TilS/MesJ
VFGEYRPYTEVPHIRIEEEHSCIDSITDLEYELLSAVERHSRRIGLDESIALSGGVDSTLLAYLVKQLHPDIDLVVYHTD